ncbi:MAG: amino acid aminotransferase [Pseudomonadota bacterium]
MFADIEALPPDPILGLSTAFANDPRADKIDLGVGVYRDADGRTPIMRAVAAGAQRSIDGETTKAYLPPAGPEAYNTGILDLLLGADHPARGDGRAVSVQAPGGCGALRLGAEFLKRAGATRIHAGGPTWANHKPIFNAAGLSVQLHPFYDQAERTILFDAFLDALRAVPAGDAVLLHGCCHNPTGADFSAEQLAAVIDVLADGGVTPFIDYAYHGFADDLEADVRLARDVAGALPEALISYSCSKNFGLYRERVGALVVVGATAKSAEAARTHVLNIAREAYSMPPAHGAAIVAEILSDAALKDAWSAELAEMASRVRGNRRLLVAAGRDVGLGNALGYIEEQRGMFSLLPVAPDAADALRTEDAIYMTRSGRINLCGITEDNAPRLCEALAKRIDGRVN